MPAIDMDKDIDNNTPLVLTEKRRWTKQLLQGIILVYDRKRICIVKKILAFM